jgi:hypothetical protein
MMFWVIPDLSEPSRFYSVDVNMNTWIDPVSHENKRIYAGTGEYHFFNMLDVSPHGLYGKVSEYEGLAEDMSNIILRASVALVDEITKNDVHDFSYGGGFEVIAISPRGF